MHSTHTGDVGAPLQRVPPLSLQGALAGSDGFENTPFVHRSMVQPLLSTGRSVSSLTVTWLPVMQMLFLQSPVIWPGPGTAVPSAVLLMPQTPAVQVRL